MYIKLGLGNLPLTKPRSQLYHFQTNKVTLHSTILFLNKNIILLIGISVSDVPYFQSLFSESYPADKYL